MWEYNEDGELERSTDQIGYQTTWTDDEEGRVTSGTATMRTAAICSTNGT